MKKNLLFLFITAISSMTALAQYAGKLDSTFGKNGIVTTNIDSAAESAYAVALQNDGKIVVAGYAFVVDDDFAIARYNKDGSLDSTFNKKGSVTTHTGLNNNVLRCVAIKKNGKIVVAGNSVLGTNNNFTVAQYNANGKLDSTFGTNGITVTPIGVSYNNLNAMALQKDGKIVVAGYAYIGSTPDFALIRYNMDGMVDTTFGGDGIVTTAVGTSEDIASSIAIQDDGKIVAAGNSISSTTNRDFALVRYNTNGSLDSSFSQDGIVTTAWSASNDIISSMVIQPNGKILATGSASRIGKIDIAIARYNSDGTIDSTFSGDGIQFFQLSKNSDNGGAICLQPNGKIIFTGWSNSNVAYNLVRVDSNGNIDYSWGDSGIVRNPSVPSGLISALVLQPNGRLIAVGYLNSPKQSLFALVRYQTELSSDIKDLQLDPFLIYPNPVSSTLNVKNKFGRLLIKISDYSGKQIYHSMTDSESVDIDVSQFENGVYFLELKSEKMIRLQKFIKL